MIMYKDADWVLMLGKPLNPAENTSDLIVLSRGMDISPEFRYVYNFLKSRCCALP
jgi:hypothetical protein